MDRGQDQIVLVEQRHAGLIAGRIRRIEREFGQKAFAGRIARGDLLQLQQISQPHLGILVNALQMRAVPEPGAFNVGRPFRIAADWRSVSTKPVQSSPARGGAGSAASAESGSAAARPSDRERAGADAGPMPGSRCSTRKPATRSRGFSTNAQQRQHVLDMGGVQKLQAAELDEGNVAPGQLDFQRAAVARTSGTAPPAA